MQHRQRLRFTVTDLALGHAIDLLNFVSRGQRCSVGWDLLMAELETRQEGKPGMDVGMASRAFDELPGAVREILGERVGVDDRWAA